MNTDAAAAAAPRWAGSTREKMAAKIAGVSKVTPTASTTRAGDDAGSCRSFGDAERHPQQHEHPQFGHDQVQQHESGE